MASITSQWIVDRLIVTPSNEFEVGINSAYISILKEIAPKSVPDQLSIDELKLKRSMSDSEFLSLTQTGINQLLEFKQRGEKLGFVKNIKELLGIGLREGKDIADKLWQM